MSKKKLIVSTTIPGIQAAHATITRDHRTRPLKEGQSPDDTALQIFDEAVAQVRACYLSTVRGRGDEWIAHIVLTVERPGDTE